ncbi:hypothetical protein BJX64DRAFT_265316 [Aspergillus heterothallicus]
MPLQHSQLLHRLGRVNPHPGIPPRRCENLSVIADPQTLLARVFRMYCLRGRLADQRARARG